MRHAKKCCKHEHNRINLFVFFQELNAEQLREAIVREIKEYHKATVPLLTFDLRPVVSLDNEMAAPAESISLPTGRMPLGAGTVPEVGGCVSVATGSLPLQEIQGSAVFSCTKTSSVSHAWKQEKPSHIQLEATTRVITDVEMLSGKLLELNMQDEGSRSSMTCGKGAELRVCGDHTDQRDVIMLSAKAKTESAEVKMRQLDTKALIKAALLNAEQRRQQHGRCVKCQCVKCQCVKCQHSRCIQM